MFLLLALACNRDLLIKERPDPEPPSDSASDLTDTDGIDTDGGNTAPIDIDLPDAGMAPDGGPLADRFDLADELQWPESFAWDSQTGSFYVGSLWFGHVRKLPVQDDESVFFQDERSLTVEPQPWKTWGIEVDPDRRRLFACASWDGGGPSSWWVWVIDLDTGERIAEIAMDGSRMGAECRDFAVGADGRAFVTDREHGLLHVIDPTELSVSVWLESPLLESNVWSGDGIALTPDGTALLVNLARTPGFVYIPLLDPASAHAVEVEGDEYQMGGGQGIDGMAFHGDVLYVAAVNRLLRLRPLDATWQRADMRSYEAPIDGMSSVTPAGDRLFALNGDPNAWTLSIRPDLPFEIYRVDTDLYP